MIETLFSWRIIVLGIVAVAIMSGALYAYIPIARRNGWVPKRYKDEVHTADSRVPVVGGGFVFYVSIMLWSLGISLIYGSNFSMTPLLVGLTMLAACSFADDLLDMKVSTRLFVQLVAVMFLLVQFLPDETYLTSLWIIVPIYVIFSIYFINAYNFMDGIDGITSGYSVVVLGSMLWINEYQEWFMSGTFIGFALLGALVFGAFNVGRKSTVYCGDVGSISMGYIVLAILTFYALYHGTLSILAVVAVYVTDTTMTILRRIKLHENIVRPHHRHLYQILTRKRNWPHLAVTSLYCGLQLLIIIGYILIPVSAQCIYTVAVYCVLAICYLVSLRLADKEEVTSAQ